MKDLIPLEKYLVTKPLGGRAAMTAGAMYGFFMGLFALFLTKSWLAFIGALAFGGVAFGMLFPWRFNRRMKKVTRDVFENRGKLATQPPMDADYQHRLLASHRISQVMAVGGALYFARDRAAFVPHAVNLAKYREPVAIPLSGATFELIAQQPTTLQKAVIANPPKMLRINAGGQTYDFIVPVPEETLEKVRANYSV